jgi:hypothetical protein
LNKPGALAFATQLPILNKALEQYVYRINRRKRPKIASQRGCLVEFKESWVETLRRVEAEQAKRDADPFRAKAEAAVRGMEAISTVALLDLLGLPKTTGNARRISPTMRSLGFIPIKSRRLMPGGYRDTVTRGWTRPVRESRCRTSLNLGEPVRTSHLNTPMHSGTN